MICGAFCHLLILTRRRRTISWIDLHCLLFRFTFANLKNINKNQKQINVKLCLSLVYSGHFSVNLHHFKLVYCTSGHFPLTASTWFWVCAKVLHFPGCFIHFWQINNEPTVIPNKFYFNVKFTQKNFPKEVNHNQTHTWYFM